MKRVIGLGGLFFKSKDPKALGAWYAKHLGLPVEDWGGAMFKWADLPGLNAEAYNMVSFFSQDTKYLAPSTSTFMINFVVEDLDALLVELEKEGVTIVGKGEESEYGKFGWVMDPEGNKVELWQAPRKV